MNDSEFPQYEPSIADIDFDQWLNDPALDNLLSADLSAGEVANQPTDSVSLWFNDIENLLMNDDDVDGGVGADQPNLESSVDYLSDYLLESPVESDCGGFCDAKNLSAGDVSEAGKNSPVEADLAGDVSEGKNSPESNLASDVSEGKNWNVSEGEEKENNGDCEGDGDDLNCKKRKRQLRNRDAAVRSRERKKLYVRDLEMKSRYLEAECKRLGMLLQCCFAENQALRISMQNIKAVNASMPKQESAVLLLESLLLGSLLWFLGIVCLFIVPKALQSTLELVLAESAVHEILGNLGPKKARSKIFVSPLVDLFMTSKRCKASRSRIKPCFPILELLV